MADYWTTILDDNSFSNVIAMIQSKQALYPAIVSMRPTVTTLSGSNFGIGG